MLKAILFDIDGTLIDSFHSNLNLYRRIWTKRGIPNFPSEEQYRPLFHLPLLECFAYLSEDKSQAEMDRLYQICMEEPSTKNYILMPHVMDILPKLHKQYALGIVTGRSELSIANFLRITKLESYFDSVIYHGLYKHSKPSPEPIQLALAELKVSPEEAIYIGDAQVDVDAAHAAGLKAILYKYDITGNHAVVGADAMIAEYTELPDLLNSLHP